MLARSWLQSHARAALGDESIGTIVVELIDSQHFHVVEQNIRIAFPLGGRVLADEHHIGRAGQAMTTRQYARLVADWIAGIGLDQHGFGTHSLRRTKATLIYRRTGNLRAVQLLLGHTRVESTVRYLGIEVDDALAIAEQVEV